MVNKIIAVFILLIFVFLLIMAIITFKKLYQFGILSIFLRNKWYRYGSLLSGLFLIQFMASGIAMLMEKSWAAPAMTYTIYFWLVYVWLYGLKEILKFYFLLNDKSAKSVSDFAGRSKFFDELLKKFIDISKQSASIEANSDEVEENHAVADLNFEAVINDEDLFKEIFPEAVKRKMKRKTIGLIVQTILFGIILLLING